MWDRLCFTGIKYQIQVRDPGPATIASIIHEVWYRYRDSLYGKALGVGTGGGGRTGGACVTCGVVSRGGGVPGARVGVVTGDAG